MAFVMDFAVLLVALLAVAVSIFYADSARRQANAAGEQVIAAREQAEVAREQADAAREQVAEAKRANDLAETRYAEQRARDAVVWEAVVTLDWKGVQVINRGFDIAEDVYVRPGGAREDWEHIDYEHEEGSEVPPNEWVTYPLDGYVSPPDRLWVLWRGEGRPRAVEVRRGPRPGRVVV